MSKKVCFFYCIFDKTVVNYTAYGGQLYMSQIVYFSKFIPKYCKKP